MSDESSQETDETAGPVAGERLAEARQLRQLSLLDVARKLHLDEPRVQALEENRFDALGAPVFAKGYLRKYAELVGVSIDDVMADYYTLNRAVGAPPIVGRVRERPPRDLHLGRWFSAILLTGLVAVVTWWWVNRPPPSATSAGPGNRLPVPNRASEETLAKPASMGADEPPATEVEAGTDGPQATGDATDNVPPARAPVRNTPQTAVPAATRAPASSVPAGAATELRLTYTGDCWTEVSDASGRRLFFDLGSNGRTVTVTGTAPLRVLVGNDDNVSLTVNGRPYRVTGAERRGNTSRFTINP